MLIQVSGTVANVEKALHSKINIYQHPKEARTFFALETDPLLNLNISILNIDGLTTYYQTHTHIHHTTNGQNSGNNGSGTGGTYVGYDFRSAYAPNVTLTGSGQTVGIVAFDGFAQSDITYYETHANPALPNVTIKPVLLGGFNGQPIGLIYGDDEVCVDIEMAISMAPGLSQVLVYEGNPDSVLYSSAWHTLLNRMATDNIAKQLSCSWYIQGGPADPAAEQIFLEMAAQGQSFFNASGDDDAYTGLIDWPGDSPNITQVGGTTLTTASAGGSYSSETVWNWGVEYGSSENGAGSGGGISTHYSIPSWQSSVSMSNNQGSTSKRNIPDVALTADHCWIFADRQSITGEGGTSFAAPLWAGFVALANQQAINIVKKTAGFINPLIYQAGTSSAYSYYFHDIQSGNNEWTSSPTKFSAVTGYDLCTGWGTPKGQYLINLLSGANLTASISGKTYLTKNQAGTYTVTASYGIPSYSYQWYKMEVGNSAAIATTSSVKPNLYPVNVWMAVGSNSTTINLSDVQNFDVKCVVTDASNTSVTSNIIYVSVGSSSASTVATNSSSSEVAQKKIVVDDENTPANISINQNYPNPFNPTTMISYQLPNDAKVTLKVFDILGREVATLIDGEVGAGIHAATFDGSRLSSGMYFVRLLAQAQGGSPFTKTIKMLMVK